MIGTLQWCATLKRFDVMHSVMIMSRFRVGPRQGHLDHLSKIFGHLRQNPETKIGFRNGIPDCEAFCSMPEHDWMHSVHGEAEAPFIDGLTPPPKAKTAQVMAFCDSALAACKVSGKASTGVLVFVNQTPVDWHSKLQKPTKTAVCGAEFSAAQTGMEKLMDILATL